MLKKLSLLTPLILFAHCATIAQTPTGNSDNSAAAQYSPNRVIQKQFPVKPDNQYLRDASMKQLFATLPYFKGNTSSERALLVAKGTELSGSMKSHYYLGSDKITHRFIFKDNGYGHQVEISTFHESDATYYDVVITDPKSGKQILKNQINYGTFNPATQEEFKTPRWIF